MKIYKSQRWKGKSNYVTLRWKIYNETALYLHISEEDTKKCF